MHVEYLAAGDGAGHASGHFEVYQTHVRRETLPNRAPTQWDLSNGVELITPTSPVAAFVQQVPAVVLASESHVLTPAIRGSGAGANHFCGTAEILATARSGGPSTNWLEWAFLQSSETAKTAIPPLQDLEEMGTVVETHRLHANALGLQLEWIDRTCLARFVVGVVSVVHNRLADITVREHVKLLWTFEFQKYLRAHNRGCVCYAYDQLSWKLHGRMVTDVALERLQAHWPWRDFSVPSRYPIEH